MTRQTLPNRRPCITSETVWQGIPVTVAVGYYPDTLQPGEVFADPMQPAARHAQISDMIRDTCTAVSVSLQHGVPPAALAKSLGSVPVPEYVDGMARMGEAPASPLGPILAEVMRAPE